MISTKAAGQGFKLYSLCVGNYLIWFSFTSKQGGIDLLEEVQPVAGLPPTGQVVVRLMERLPAYGGVEAGKNGTIQPRYVVYIDNFFTSFELLCALRERGFAACGTCKRGSGINNELLIMKECLSKGKDWGKTAYSTRDKKVICIGFQDNNTVLLMTTAHSINEAKEQCPKDRQKRNIPDEVVEWVDEEKNLMFPKLVIEYNKHMGGSDGNAQQRAVASPAAHRDLRYWWPMFLFMLEASVLNAYLLYKQDHPQNRCTKREFQRQIALVLIRNPLGQTKKVRTIPSDVGLKRKYAGPEHEWEPLSKRRYCKKTALREVSANLGIRKRPPQVQWGCKHPDCLDKAICKPQCWEKAHVGCFDSPQW